MAKASGAWERLARRRQCETAKDPEVVGIGREDRGDALDVIGRGKQGVEEAFAAQSIRLHPDEELFGDQTVWEQLLCVACQPPSVRANCCLDQGEGASEASRISNDVDELCEYLWGKRHSVAVGKHLVESHRRRLVIDVLFQA